jgi:NadR type nicotinamide-nucleotide adenylyltransferase
MLLKKIVILGPESTGKSTLCQQLAAHYKTEWVPEYAREYLQANGKNYTYDDLSKIAKGQIDAEDSAAGSGHWTSSAEPATHNNQPVTPLFIDTDLYVIKIWSEFVFNKCENHILTQIAQRTYDLYLLCNTDLPWKADLLREYPDLNTREKIYHYYRDAMVNQPIPWVDISGLYEQRLQKAIHSVDRILL